MGGSATARAGLLAIAALAIVAPAKATPRWSADGAMAVSGYHLDTRAPTDAVLAGLGARGAAGTRFIGYRAGFDARFGAALQGGFAHDTALYPLGIAIPMASIVAFGASAGIGADGVTGRIPSTGRIPVEFAIDLRAPRWLRVGAFLRPAWVFADARRDGSPALAWADEFDSGLLVRVGKGDERHFMIWGNGLFVALHYGERLGATWLGVSIGHGIDMRSKQRD